MISPLSPVQTSPGFATILLNAINLSSSRLKLNCQNDRATYQAERPHLTSFRSSLGAATRTTHDICAQWFLSVSQIHFGPLSNCVFGRRDRPGPAEPSFSLAYERPATGIVPHHHSLRIALCRHGAHSACPFPYLLALASPLTCGLPLQSLLVPI